MVRSARFRQRLTQQLCCSLQRSLSDKNHNSKGRTEQPDSRGNRYYRTIDCEDVDPAAWSKRQTNTDAGELGLLYDGQANTVNFNDGYLITRASREEQAWKTFIGSRDAVVPNPRHPRTQ